MTTRLLEAPHDADQAEELIYGPELLPIRFVNNSGRIEASLGVDLDGQRWSLPVIQRDDGQILVFLDDKVRAFWRWYLLDRND